MSNILRKFYKGLRRLGLSESGAATVEFVVVFPFFVGVFVSAYEVAVMNMRAVMLERATDVVVREIRLTGGGDLNYDRVVEAICERTLMIPQCVDSTKIELRPVDTTTWDGLTNDLSCIRREETIQAPIRFRNGVENEMMLMRVCSIVQPLFPTFGVGRSIPRDESGEHYRLIASTAFVNEPQ